MKELDGFVWGQITIEEAGWRHEDWELVLMHEVFDLYKDLMIEIKKRRADSSANFVERSNDG